MSDQDFLSSQGLVPFRIFLARHRLGYLKHLAKHGLTLLFGKTYVNATLGSELSNEPYSIAQERIAYQIRFYHHNMVCELEQFGMRLLQSGDTPYVCNAAFSSPQQLAVHSFKMHGKRAIESYYMQSEVCPGCSKTFHTTFRVVQHLRYRANKCWERICGVRVPGEPVCFQLPPHHAGVHQLPALRQNHGPLRPTAHPSDRQRVRTSIAELREKAEPDYAWWDPSTSPELTFSAVCTLP